MTTEVETGSKVRATFEGTLINTSYNGNKNVRTENGSQFTVPKDAKIEVLEVPLPPEPPVGTVLRAKGSGWTFLRTDERAEGHWLVHIAGIRWTWKDVWEYVGPGSAGYEELKPATDLSDVKPFDHGGWNEPEKAKYVACMGGGDVKVWRPDSGEHIRFQHANNNIFCLYGRDAITLAKRILKTFEGEN